MSRLLVVIGWLNGWLVTSCCNGLLIITAKCIIGCVVCTSVVYLECTVVNCTSTSTSTSILAGIVHFFFFALLWLCEKKERRRVPDPENIHSYNQKCIVSVRKEKITTPFTTSSVANNTGLPFTTNTTAPEND